MRIRSLGKYCIVLLSLLLILTVSATASDLQSVEVNQDSITVSYGDSLEVDLENALDEQGNDFQDSAEILFDMSEVKGIDNQTAHVDFDQSGEAQDVEVLGPDETEVVGQDDTEIVIDPGEDVFEFNLIVGLDYVTLSHSESGSDATVFDLAFKEDVEYSKANFTLFLDGKEEYSENIVEVEDNYDLQISELNKVDEETTLEYTQGSVLDKRDYDEDLLDADELTVMDEEIFVKGWMANNGITLHRPNSNLYLHDELDSQISRATERDIEALEDAEFQNEEDNLVEASFEVGVGSLEQKWSSEDGYLDDPELYLALPSGGQVDSQDYAIYLESFFSDTVNFTNSGMDGEEIILFDKVFKVDSEQSESDKIVLVGEEDEIVLEDMEEVKADGEAVDGTYVDIWEDDGEVSELTVYMGAEDSDAEVLEQGEAYQEKVFDTFKLNYGGIIPDAKEDYDSTVRIENDKSQSDITFTTDSGEEETITHAHRNGQFEEIRLASDDEDEAISTYEGQQMREDDYFVLNVDERSSFFQVHDIDFASSGEESETAFKNYHTGSLIELTGDDFDSSPSGELPDYFDFDESNAGFADFRHNREVYTAVVVEEGSHGSDEEAVHVFREDTDEITVFPVLYTESEYSVAFMVEDLEFSQDYFDETDESPEEIRLPSTKLTADQEVGWDELESSEEDVGEITYSLDEIDGSIADSTLRVEDWDHGENSDAEYVGVMLMQPEDNNEEEHALIYHPELSGDEIESLEYTYTGSENAAFSEAEDAWMYESDAENDYEIGYTAYGTYTEHDLTEDKESIDVHLLYSQSTSGFAITGDKFVQNGEIINTEEKPIVEVGVGDSELNGTASTFRQALTPGWNTFSIPVSKPEETYNFENLMEEEERENIEAVWSMKGGEWTEFSDPNEEEVEIEGGKGYLVKVKDESNPVIELNVDNRFGAAQNDIEPGWNLIGHYQEYNQVAFKEGSSEEALYSVKGSIDGENIESNLFRQKSSGTLQLEGVEKGEKLETGSAYWLRTDPDKTTSELGEVAYTPTKGHEVLR